MPLCCRTALFAAAIFTLAAGFSPARAEDAGTVRKRLDAAKKAYERDAERFNKAVADLLARREADARRLGNKRLVDQVKVEQRVFERLGYHPPLPPPLLSQIKAARATLDRAYSAAVKDYVRLKEDAAAESTEKEQQKFALDSALLLGKRTYLANLKPFDVRVWNNAFENDAGQFKLGGEAVPHGVFMHPNFRGDASASYALPPKAVAFCAVVGVPKHERGQGNPASPLVFEVLGDGVSLWKSEPVEKLDTPQACAVRVGKVKTLTLRVHCPREHGGAHAVWFAPAVVE